MVWLLGHYSDSYASNQLNWADTYFEIAKRHDEFGYLSRAEIAIQVDSRELRGQLLR